MVTQKGWAGKQFMVNWDKTLENYIITSSAFFDVPQRIKLE